MNRLLIIDDDPAWRALYRMTFQDQFELFEAVDAQEALYVLERVNPHVILLDLRMPRMSGLDFMKRLDSKGVRIPIVVCSGAGEVERLRVAGVRTAAKAPDLRELRAALKEVAPAAPAAALSASLSSAQDDTYWRD